LYKSDSSDKNSESLGRLQYAIKTLCQECILTPNVYVDNWADYELEMFFIKLRIFSLGEDINRIHYCEHIDNENQMCGTEMNIHINLHDVSIHSDDTCQSEFKLNDQYTLRVKSPSLFSISKTDMNMDLITLALDTLIYSDGETTIEYPFADQTKEDIEAFLRSSITPKIKHQINLLFFNKLPHLHHQTIVTCPVCGNKTRFTSNKLMDFFR
jgi:hypothetical protein